MRFMKRLLRILVLVVLLGGIGVAILYHMSRLTPSRYTPALLTDEQRYEMSQRVDTQKIPKLVNLARDAQNRENKVLKGLPVEAATQPALLTLSFTQDELNATLWKWSGPYKANYERYVTDPFISLQTGTITLMATSPEFGRVLSAGFEPKIDEKGMLHCDLGSLKLGSLPLPEGVLSSKREKLEAALMAKLPQWQTGAKIDATGVANSDAKAADLSKMILQLLHHEPSPAVIFVQNDAKHTIPVRLTKVTVEEGSLTITVQPMTAGERGELLEAIRKPEKTGAPEASQGHT
jgi:hypothetical protein